MTTTTRISPFTLAPTVDRTPRVNENAKIARAIDEIMNAFNMRRIDSANRAGLLRFSDSLYDTMTAFEQDRADAMTMLADLVNAMRGSELRGTIAMQEAILALAELVDEFSTDDECAIQTPDGLYSL